MLEGNTLLSIIGGAITLIIALIGFVWKAADDTQKEHERRLIDLERVQAVICEQIGSVRDDISEIKQNVNTLLRR